MDLEYKLNTSWAIQCTADLAEVRIQNSRIRLVEGVSIEGVEQFRSELGVHGFVNWEGLVDAEVFVCKTK